MTGLLSSFFRMNWISSFPTKWVYVGEGLSALMNLIVLWFTAKAFAPAFGESLKTGSMSYFEFVLWGEWLMALPMLFLVQPVTAVQTAIQNGSLEAYILARRPISQIFLIDAFSALPRELFRVLLTLTLAVVIFGFHFPNHSLLPIFALQLLTIPTFVGLGFLTAAVVLFFGRGAGVVHHLTTAMSVFAGVYFPLSVFPEELSKLLVYLSPFAALLADSRELLAGEWPEQALIAHLVWGVFSLALGLALFHASFEQIRKKGSLPLLGQ